MKAVEWAAKFQAATTPEEVALVLDEYGKETADLIAARTNKSVDKSRLPAMEGAVKEQQNKFRSITDRVPTLTPAMLDAVLETHAKDYLALKAKATKKPEEAKAEGEAKDGRTFAQNGPRRDRKHQPQKTQQGNQPRRIG